MLQLVKFRESTGFFIIKFLNDLVDLLLLLFGSQNDQPVVGCVLCNAMSFFSSKGAGDQVINRRVVFGTDVMSLEERSVFSFCFGVNQLESFDNLFVICRDSPGQNFLVIGIKGKETLGTVACNRPIAK